MSNIKLTASQVRAIRTEGMTDTHWSRVWGVHVRTIREARIGKTHKGVETPPDTAPRGNVPGSAKAVAARRRRAW